MKISPINWMCNSNADVHDDSSTDSVGAFYQLRPYCGVPVRPFTHGSLQYDLGGSYPVSVIGLLGVRYHCLTPSTQYTINVIGRNGGSGGTIVIDEDFTFTDSPFYDLYDSMVTTITEENIDFLEINFPADLSDKVVMIGRIWIGESYVEFDEINQYSYSIVDNAKIEQNAVGGTVKNDVLLYRQVAVTSAQVRDTLQTGDNATITDLKRVFGMFSRNCTNREICVIGGTGIVPAFHGRFIEEPMIKKGPGVLYFTNMKIKEF